MKTKLFLAFLTVILTALFSNFIFEWLIMRDFEGYVRSVEEDQFYWTLASIEASYSDKGWDKKALSEAIHWAMMLGLDMKVIGEKGKEIISSHEIMESLSDTMKQRMEGLCNVHMHKTEGRYKEHRLLFRGRQIGLLLSRPFPKEELKEKEAAFKNQTKNFIYVSFLIAGAGLLLIALLFSQYLSKPIMNLKTAAEKIAQGDFDVRTSLKSQDEVGRLSEAFNKMAESLQREEGLRRRLFSNIAHELRTPLTILKTQAEAISDGVIDREKGLDNIKNEIERLIKLVKGIEDITAAEASFFAKGETTRINLREFLSGITDEMLPAFKEKGLDLKTTDKGPIDVVVDTEKLERIVRNIIANSLKFTEKGGVWIDYGISEKTFFIDIKDSGRGIPENEMPLIFNRFYRGEKSPIPAFQDETQAGIKAYEGGLGLGLAIVKELVDVMEGRIEVKSKVNEGTRFRIYFKVSA